MAITASTAAAESILRIEWQDKWGEKVIQNIALDGAVTQATVIEILTQMDALSNAQMLKATLFAGTAFIGMKGAALAAASNHVSDRMELTFTKVNPVNAAKTVAKTIAVPAPLDALIDTTSKPYHPVTTSTPLNTLNTDLAASLNYLGANGTLYPGGFAYANGESGFVSVADQIDGM